MADSDDFGDDFDDTAFLEAATQAERDNTPSSQPSPRPLKRRRLEQSNERTQPIPPNKQQRNHRHCPFVSSDEGISEPEEIESFAPRKKSTLAGCDDGDLSTAATSVSSAARKKKARARRNDWEDGEPEGQSPKKETAAEKRRNRIHVPTNELDLTEHFLTQPSREPSPPWKPRGAIWQKSKTIGVHRPAGVDVMKTMAMPGGQSISSRPISQASKSPEKRALVIRTEDSPKLPTPDRASTTYDPAQELADLPSDAFASSSSSPQKEDDVFLVSERRTRVVAPQVGLRQTTLFGRGEANGVVPASQANKRYNFIVDQKDEPPTHHKLDPEAMKTWVYPTNLGTIRDYQFNIVQRGLFHNLLVALPTGLGKTFIAATIMLNWFRWTTEAQIVFVAPTKPLVSQQIDACFHIVGIPRSHTTMLTGGVTPALRAQEWLSKRVFFMTPQTLLNDLKAGYADPKKIVLLVVDEAHRATGSYAYVEVVSFLRRFNNSFRVLALTATPGADVESVQKVIDGLDISRVEIRTENSLDIRGFVHHRQVEKHVFKNSDEMEMCMELYSKALQSCVNKIAGLNAFYSTNPLEITPFGCMQARKRWYQEAGKHTNQGQKAMVHAVFTVLGSISQGMELLKFHGIKPFYVKMKEFKESQAESKSKYRNEICDSEHFKKLMVRLQTWSSNENFVGHPKLEFLQQVILEHFVNAEGSALDGTASQTRIMVFAHFRDSAEEIVRVLKKHQPMIRPRVFVGQSTGKHSEGMDQKEQLDVIENFKKGTFNTLVATSIGEEGLDIGEVNLIICYDSKASPIRMLQRMGRTGRKREGKIVMLQMEGKEERDATKAKDNYEKMQELIAEGSRFTFHDEISRRILPREVQPVVERRPVEIPLENSQADWLPEPKKKRGRAPKKPPKKFHMPDGVLTGFVTAARMDEEIVPKSRGKKAPLVYPSEEVFQPPPLESVLLDDIAASDLERKYQTVFDDEDAPMIDVLDLSTQAHYQRVLSRTHHFRHHGRVTQSFVDMLWRMHEMDDDRIGELQSNFRESDCTLMPSDVVVSDIETRPPVQDEMWADDDPASQPLPKSEAKPGPKPRAKPPQEKLPPKPRGRPRKDQSTMTPVRQTATLDTSKTLGTKTPNWRVSALAGEAASSSPLPTDPHMRVASQAETIGSDDTVGAGDLQDTQAYRLDSDLVSFIAEDDEEEVEVPESSLPNTSFNGLGKGTQAVVEAARQKRPKMAEKIFTSDPTDDDAVVSSDSDDDILIRRGLGKDKSKAMAFVVDPASEEDEPVVPKKRARRVVQDDDDED
ncbi:P-loop containing nucleoside triphosphate hydrolase protein [Lentithecium fluviatile CBS 122367]|uniref:ATP-dependent DNA helicase n=1 Tax=Lentithecium fluviatile CBS 122367 TaxID=1168545 RepID=A0A6G1IXP9_9PLEO|nr:P-loop containing nucleoside triphosphate hydrolase protein [Lentithecium fluviatile CBS 122367]